jgi:hypothetical protein
MVERRAAAAVNGVDEGGKGGDGHKGAPAEAHDAVVIVPARKLDARMGRGDVGIARVRVTMRVRLRLRARRLRGRFGAGGWCEGLVRLGLMRRLMRSSACKAGHMGRAPIRGHVEGGVSGAICAHLKACRRGAKEEVNVRVR